MKKILRGKDKKKDIDVQTEVECQEESIIEGVQSVERDGKSEERQQVQTNKDPKLAENSGIGGENNKLLYFRWVR